MARTSEKKKTALQFIDHSSNFGKSLTVRNHQVETMTTTYIALGKCSFTWCWTHIVAALSHPCPVISAIAEPVTSKVVMTVWAITAPVILGKCKKSRIFTNLVTQVHKAGAQKQLLFVVAGYLIRYNAEELSSLNLFDYCA